MKKSIILYYKHSDREYCVVEFNGYEFMLIKYKDVYPYSTHIFSNFKLAFEMFIKDVYDNRLKQDIKE